jgi:hypothetical protein
MEMPLAELRCIIDGFDIKVRRLSERYVVASTVVNGKHEGRGWEIETPRVDEEPAQADIFPWTGNAIDSAILVGEGVPSSPAINKALTTAAKRAWSELEPTW